MPLKWKQAACSIVRLLFITYIFTLLISQSSEQDAPIQPDPVVSIGAEVFVTPSSATCGTNGVSGVSLGDGDYLCNATCRSYTDQFGYQRPRQFQELVLGGPMCQSELSDSSLPQSRRKRASNPSIGTPGRAASPLPAVSFINTCFAEAYADGYALYKKASYLLAYTATSDTLGTVFTDGLIKVRASQSTLNITCLGGDCYQQSILASDSEQDTRIIITHHYDDTQPMHLWIAYQGNVTIGSITSARTPSLPPGVNGWSSRVGATFEADAGECQVLEPSHCRNTGNSYSIILPNTLGHVTQEDVMASNVFTYLSDWDEACKYFQCAVLFPACVDQQPRLPCQSFCQEMRSKCEMTGYEAIFNCSRLPSDNCIVSNNEDAEVFFEGRIDEVRLYEKTLTEREAIFELDQTDVSVETFFSQLNVESHCLCPEDAPFIETYTAGHLNVTCYDQVSIYQSRLPHWPHPQYLTDGYQYESYDFYQYFPTLASERTMWISEPGHNHIVLEVKLEDIFEITSIAVISVTYPARNFTLIERRDGFGVLHALKYFAWDCSQAFIRNSGIPCTGLNSITPVLGEPNYLGWSVYGEEVYSAYAVEYGAYDSDPMLVDEVVVASAVRITLDGLPVAVNKELNPISYDVSQHGSDYHALTEIFVRGNSACQCYSPGTVGNQCNSNGQCQCMDGVDADLAGPSCMPYISSIYPDFGPVAGGTTVTVKGNLFPYLESISINLNWMSDNRELLRVEYPTSFPCYVVSSNSTTIVCTTGAAIEDLLIPGANNGTLELPTLIEVVIYEAVTVVARGQFTFTYKPNPVIHQIKPGHTILSGGIIQTVTGENLDSVAGPIYNVNMTYLGSIIPLQPQLCVVINQTVMECPTPPIVSNLEEIPEAVLDYLRNKDNEKTDEVVNEQIGDLSFHVGFTLDGVDSYRDLNQRLPDYSTLSVYFDPDIFPFEEEDGIRDYSPTEPINTENLLIQGARLTTGAGINDFTVTIGEEECHVHYLTSNEITCLPPAEEPSNTLYTKDGAPRVLASVGFKEVTVGYLQYPESVWDSLAFLLGIIFLILFLILLIIIIIIIVRYRRRQREKRGGWNKDAPEIGMQSVTLLDLLGKEMQLILQGCLIPWESLKIAERIGQGHFGQVCEGTLTHEDGTKETVAIKTLKKEGVRLGEIEEFLEEATIMRDLHHPNILTLHGVCVNKRDVYVVLPFMENGALREYLMKPTLRLTVLELLGFAAQVACGMAYLEENKFVHRDLAARNCMIDSKMVVKVADFGLARDVYDKQYYRTKKQRPLPVRWMAPECLKSDCIFSSKSDVWSFGVLVWEILTRGQTPYSDVGNFHIKTYIEQGYRLKEPKYCPQKVYRMMLHCWSTDPADRPTFSELHSYLSALIDPSDIEDSDMSNFDNNVQGIRSAEPFYLTNGHAEGASHSPAPPNSGGHTTPAVSSTRRQMSQKARGEYVRLSSKYDDTFRDHTVDPESRAAQQDSYLSIVEPAYEGKSSDYEQPVEFTYENAAFHK